MNSFPLQVLSRLLAAKVLQPYRDPSHDTLKLWLQLVASSITHDSRDLIDLKALKYCRCGFFCNDSRSVPGNSTEEWQPSTTQSLGITRSMSVLSDSFEGVECLSMVWRGESWWRFWRDGLLSEPPRFGEVSFSVSTQCVRSYHSGCATNVAWSLAGSYSNRGPICSGDFFLASLSGCTLNWSCGS